MNRFFPLGLRSLVLLALVGLLPHVGNGQEGLRRHLSSSLLDAFRDATHEAAQSTVQIYCDNYRACLGVVVRPDGQIVTKASELKGKIECQLKGESEKHEARIVARDPATDLALLKIDAKNLPAARFGTGEAPPVGSFLVTCGITDKPLTIGVVSVAARKILPPQAALGIQLEPADNQARIAAVQPGMAAERAGLKDGDIIRQVNGEEIAATQQLQKTIRARQPGDKVAVVVERDGKQLSFEVTLGNMADLVHDERSDFQNSLGGSLSERRSGFPLAIQHDSVLRPSECGGPIVDLDGHVVGLNIARAGRVESYALPASTVRESVDQMLHAELVASPAEQKFTGSKSPTGQER